MIKVCDAIMGTGKSSAAITYMNEHYQDKFIYITPYLEEAARIKESCPSLHFVEPSNKLREYGFNKGSHTAELIRRGTNISTTHQAFKNYTQEMLEDIREKGYTLIIDENVDVLEKCVVDPGDLQLVTDAGFLELRDGIYHRTDKQYTGGAFSNLFHCVESRELMRMECSEADDTTIFYWVLPPDLITAFRDVFILTYLFEGQSLHHFLEVFHLPYERIGVSRNPNGECAFCAYPGDVPEYVSHLGDMIDILDHKKLNQIGDDRCALSRNWFLGNDGGIKKLKDDLYNYFHNICGGVPANRKLWGTFSTGGVRSKLRGKGYSNGFLAFNQRATNAYRDRDCLAYPINIFMNTNDKVFYSTHGVKIDEDVYALSIMVQWIWRSAIRDGKKIHIYIPSKRMRTLLENWIQTVSKGGDAA